MSSSDARGGKNPWIPLQVGTLVAVLVFLAGHTLFKQQFSAWELRLLDERFKLPQRQVPIDPRIRLVYFDDATFDQVSHRKADQDVYYRDIPFSLWLPYFGRATRALLGAGASVVGLDVLLYKYRDDGYTQFLEGSPILKDYMDMFPEPDPNNPAFGTFDLSMAAAVEAPDRVVLGTFLIDRPEGKFDELVAAVAPQNIADLALSRDLDGICRAQIIHPVPAKWANLEWLSPFAGLLAEKLQGDSIGKANTWKTSGQPIKVSGDGRLRINFTPRQAQTTQTGDPEDFRDPTVYRPFPVYFLDQILDWSQHDPDRLRREFAGTVVIIGSASPHMQDFHPIPGSGARPGPEIHATALNTLLTGAYLHQLSPIENGVFLWFVCLVSGYLTYRTRFTAGVFLVGAMALLTLISVSGVFAYYGLWVELFPLLVGIFTTWGFCLGWRVREEQKEKGFVRNLFGRYVSDEVMEELLKDPRQSMVGAVGKRRVTVLFTDINGFSTSCERHTAEDILAMLNAYFEEMNQIIFHHGGTIKQFVGDEIMVMYGAPGHHMFPEHSAVLTAIEMIERLKELERLDPDGVKGFYRVKIGIHTGDVIVGNVGSRRRTEYAAVGDDVNLGSRIMGMTKGLGATILISAATYAKVKDMDGVRFISKGSHPVKGRKEGVELYAVEKVTDDLETDSEEGKTCTPAAAGN